MTIACVPGSRAIDNRSEIVEEINGNGRRENVNNEPIGIKESAFRFAFDGKVNNICEPSVRLSISVYTVHCGELSRNSK